MSKFTCGNCYGCDKCQQYYVELANGDCILRKKKCKYDCEKEYCGYGHGQPVVIRGFTAWSSNVKPASTPKLVVSSPSFKPTEVKHSEPLKLNWIPPKKPTEVKQSEQLKLNWGPEKKAPEVNVFDVLARVADPPDELITFALENSELNFKSEPVAELSLTRKGVMKTCAWFKKNINNEAKGKELIALIAKLTLPPASP